MPLMDPAFLVGYSTGMSRRGVASGQHVRRVAPTRPLGGMPSVAIAPQIRIFPFLVVFVVVECRGRESRAKAAFGPLCNAKQ